MRISSPPTLTVLEAGPVVLTLDYNAASTNSSNVGLSGTSNVEVYVGTAVDSNNLWSSGLIGTPSTVTLPTGTPARGFACYVSVFDYRTPAAGGGFGAVRCVVGIAPVPTGSPPVAVPTGNDIKDLVEQVTLYLAPVLDGLEVLSPTANPPLDGVVWRYSHTGFVAADGVAASTIEGGLTVWLEVYSQTGGIGRLSAIAEQIVSSLIRAPEFEAGDTRIEYRDGTAAAVGPQDGGQQLARAIIRYNVFRLITD